MVEHDTRNVGGAGSSPVAGSLPGRLMGRTPDFESGNRGSMPRRAILCLLLLLPGCLHPRLYLHKDAQADTVTQC